LSHIVMATESFRADCNTTGQSRVPIPKKYLALKPPFQFRLRQRAPNRMLYNLLIVIKHELSSRDKKWICVITDGRTSKAAGTIGSSSLKVKSRDSHNCRSPRRVDLSKDEKRKLRLTPHLKLGRILPPLVLGALQDRALFSISQNPPSLTRKQGNFCLENSRFTSAGWYLLRPLVG